eukprot:g18730.t1
MDRLDAPLSKLELRRLERLGKKPPSGPGAQQKAASAPKRACEATMNSARGFFEEGRGSQDMRTLKKVNAYLVDACWDELRAEIARPDCSEGIAFLESDGTTKRTAVHEEHFQSTGALKWMCMDASAELFHTIGEDPSFLPLPTDIVGFVEARPKTEGEAKRLPLGSTLRHSEGFDHACLVLDQLAGIAEKPHGKPVVGVLPTDSGGSTENQQTYTVRVHEEVHKESDMIFWPDYCRVHVTAISGQKGFGKFCRILSLDPKEVEKKLYLAGWAINEKGCAIHTKVARDFDAICPRWGDAATFPSTQLVDGLLKSCNLGEKVVSNLTGRISRNQQGRLISKLPPKGLEQLKNDVHKVCGKVTLPVWTRWFTFFNFCARLKLLLVFGIVGILQAVYRAPMDKTNKYQLPQPYYNKNEEEDDSLLLLLVVLFTPEFTCAAEAHNARMLKEDGSRRSLAELRAAYKADVAAQLQRLGNSGAIKQAALSHFPGKTAFTEREEDLIESARRAALRAVHSVAADIEQESFLKSNSQREFVHRLEFSTAQDALQYALSFRNMEAPQNLADIVMRQIGTILGRLKNEQTQLRYIRGCARLLPTRVRRHTGRIERFIGRAKANVCRNSNGKLNGLPTTSCISNRKDLKDVRCEIETQLEEHADREAAAAGSTDEDTVEAGKRKYQVVRDHDLLMSVFMKSEKLQAVPTKERIALAKAMCKNPEDVQAAQDQVRRLREEKEEQVEILPEPVVEAAGAEEEEPLRAKKALLRMQKFYDRVQERCLERVEKMEHPFVWGPKEMARRTDRAQQIIKYSVPATTLTIRKVASCYHLGRISVAVNKKLKAGKTKSDVVEDLGGFIPAVLSDQVEAEAEHDVAADQQQGPGALPANNQQLPNANCVLGVGLVAYFPRKNSPTWDPFLIVNQDLGSYHFQAAKLVPPAGRPDSRILDVVGDYLFSDQDRPCDTHDLERVTIHLAVGQPKQLAAQNKPVSKLERRLKELAELQNQERIIRDGIERKVVGVPPIKRPAPPKAADAGAPAPKRPVSKEPTQELSQDDLVRHKKQKQEQQAKIKRLKKVEGFRIVLNGSVSTQRKTGRAYDAAEAKIMDAELKQTFLNLQQGGDVDFICRAKKQCHRFFSFEEHEEEFAECLGLAWAARTRFLLTHGRRYAKDRSYTSPQPASTMRKALAEAIRPWFCRAIEVAGSCSKKKDQARVLAKASDATLRRLEPGRGQVFVDGAAPE